MDAPMELFNKAERYPYQESFQVSLDVGDVHRRTTEDVRRPDEARKPDEAAKLFGGFIVLLVKKYTWHLKKNKFILITQMIEGEKVIQDLQNKVNKPIN